jgi:adenylate cyclase
LSERLADLSALTERLGRCRDLEAVLTEALDSLASIFGFEHSLLLMLDETGSSLFTIASRGYERAGIGSEVAVGQGIIGKAAADGLPMRVGNLQRMLVYARSARGTEGSGREIPLPGLPSAQSQLAAPAIVMGETLGVLVVESDRLAAFSAEDERLLTVVAHLVAAAIELDRVGGRSAVLGDPPEEAPAPAAPQPRPGAAVVRFYPVDGSTFIDGDYLVKGVPGRILWRLVSDYVEDGRTEFTNREVRLDPSLELPAFRDNLESRLILLKRRLDERAAPMRIDKTGRGRFRLVVSATLTLESPGAGTGP